MPTTAEGLTRLLLAQMRVREQDYLLMDEGHDVFELSNEREKKKFRKFLKTASQSNTWPITIILVGCPQLILSIEQDPELETRALPVVIESLHPTAHQTMVAKKLLRPLAKIAGLSLNSQSEEIASRLIVAAGCQIGRCVHMTKEATVNAIVAGSDELNVQHFAMMYRTAKSAVDEANPFLSANYLDIPSGKLAMTTERIAKEQLAKITEQQEIDRIANKQRRRPRKADRK